jgi:hypothetical protein
MTITGYEWMLLVTLFSMCASLGAVGTAGALFSKLVKLLNRKSQMRRVPSAAYCLLKYRV